MGREGRHRRWDLAERVYPKHLPEYDEDEAAHLLEERTTAGGRHRKATPLVEPGGEPRANLRPSRAADGSSAWTLRHSQHSTTRTTVDGSRSSTPTTECSSTARASRRSSSSSTCWSSSSPSRSGKYGFFAHPILMGDRFVGMLDAEVDKAREVLRVNAVHEFLPFEPEEHEMVRAEISELGGVARRRGRRTPAEPVGQATRTAYCRFSQSSNRVWKSTASGPGRSSRSVRVALK